MQAEATPSGERYLEALNSYFDRKGPAVMSGALAAQPNTAEPLCHSGMCPSQPPARTCLERLCNDVDALNL